MSDPIPDDGDYISPLAPAQSPLAEADPNSINELIQQRIDTAFNTRPLLVTDDHLREMVKYYIAKRHVFMLKEAETANKEPKKRAAAKPKTIAEITGGDDFV